MRANKTTLLFVLGLFMILFCAVPANMHYISTPRLVIKFDGKPASNVTLILPAGNKRSHQLDADGAGKNTTKLATAIEVAKALLAKPVDGQRYSTAIDRLRREIRKLKGVPESQLDSLNHFPEKATTP